MSETEKQFSLTRAALSTCGRAQNQILICRAARLREAGNPRINYNQAAPYGRTIHTDRNQYETKHNA
jgi:hypothetical protein